MAASWNFSRDDNKLTARAMNLGSFAAWQCSFVRRDWITKERTLPHPAPFRDDTRLLDELNLNEPHAPEPPTPEEDDSNYLQVFAIFA